VFGAFVPAFAILAKGIKSEVLRRRLSQRVPSVSLFVQGPACVMKAELACRPHNSGTEDRQVFRVCAPAGVAGGDTEHLTQIKDVSPKAVALRSLLAEGQ
jgi:hypothetical protein